MDLPRYIRVAERANLIEKNDLINQPENSPPLSKKVVHVLQYFPKKVTEMGIWWNTFYILLFFFCYFSRGEPHNFRYFFPVAWFLQVCFGGWCVVISLVVCIPLFFLFMYLLTAYVAGRAISRIL